MSRSLATIPARAHQLGGQLPQRPLDLEAPGAILLLSSYELGHQPLNLAFPLASLRRAGYRPVAVDAAVAPPDDATIAAARLVAISAPMHTALRLGVELAARIKRRNPDALLCFYGLYAWLNAEYLLHEWADFVIGGEYEAPLLSLIQALARGEPGPVPGVSDRVHRADPSLVRVDFPPPDRSTLPSPRHYAQLVIGGRAVWAGYTETTRGCHHTCLHCPVVPVYRGRFFALPRHVVLADIRRQVRQGVRHITFGDPDFLNGPTHSLRICRALHEEFPEVTFDFTTRIEHILRHRELFPEFRRLGCLFVVSAVESTSDLVLEKIDKGHRKADVVEALRVLDEAGIAMRPSLLPFTPWTTLQDYLELLDFIEEQGLIEHVDPVHLSIRLLVPPGSALLDQPETAEWIGPLDEAALTYTWCHSDPRVDHLQREVAALVERASTEGWDNYTTFAAVRALACAAAGIEPPTELPRRGQRPTPPHLTEPWFC
jgi:radical SAM superfamily enzyme YgiQ (UPF0313 family)